MFLLERTTGFKPATHGSWHEALSVRRVLRPAIGRVFPVLLSPIRHEIEDVVDEQNPIDAAGRGAVGAVDVVTDREETR